MLAKSAIEVLLPVQLAWSCAPSELPLKATNPTDLWAKLTVLKMDPMKPRRPPWRSKQSPRPQLKRAPAPLLPMAKEKGAVAEKPQAVISLLDMRPSPLMLSIVMKPVSVEPLGAPTSGAKA